MYELLVSWKKLFTNPSKAFSHITGQEKVAAKLMFVLAVSMAAAIPLFPIISSDAFVQSYSSASMRMMQEMGLDVPPEVQEELYNRKPVMAASLITVFLLQQVFDIGFRLVVSALAIMLTGFFFRERRPYRSYISMFTVLALFWILENAARGTIALASNVTPALATARSAVEVLQLLVPRTSLAVFLPENLGVFTSYTIDYCTDIFRIVQLAFLAIALSVVWQREMRTAVSATIIYAMAYYLYNTVSIMQILGK